MKAILHPFHCSLWIKLLKYAKSTSVFPACYQLRSAVIVACFSSSPRSATTPCSRSSSPPRRHPLCTACTLPISSLSVSVSSNNSRKCTHDSCKSTDNSHQVIDCRKGSSRNHCRCGIESHQNHSKIVFSKVNGVTLLLHYSLFKRIVVNFVFVLKVWHCVTSPALVYY